MAPIWNSSGRFDAAARNWDDNPRRMDLARRIFETLERNVPLSSDWRVLEIGCGTGLVSRPLAEKTASLLAVDTSREMLRMLEEKISAAGPGNVETVEGDISSVRREHEPGVPFNLVFSAMTFHHIVDPRLAVRQAHALLAEGGWLAIADLDKEDGCFHDDSNQEVHHGFERKSFETMLREEGFREISFSTAASVTKINRAGKERIYTVFLAVSRKQ